MYALVDGLEFREVGTETLVHDKKNEKIHVVNQTAADLLKICSGKTEGEMAEYLRSHYEVDERDIEADVRDILTVLQERGLIKRALTPV
jgi:hypothetical protein